MKTKLGKDLLMLFVVTTTGLLGACTSQEVKKELDVKVEAAPVAANPGEVAEKGRAAIMESKTLTPEQKEKMMTLMNRTHSDLTLVREETTKLKMVLFEDLMKDNYKASEVKEIKKRITKNERKKLSLMFSSLEEAQKILGKSPVTKDEFKSFMNWQQNYDRF